MNPSLDAQIRKNTTQLKRQIEKLDDNDPFKPWFEFEWSQLQLTEGESIELDEGNSRLRALKQLAHLIFEHCVKIQNPKFDEPAEVAESILTIQAKMPSHVKESTRELRFSIEPRLLHEHERENTQFDPVSPTAKIVGYLRSLDNSLIWASDFLIGQEGRELLDQLEVDDQRTRMLMAILFQSRYHALNMSIASEENPLQVLEFAAGISPRGFQWSQMSPGTIYVESDLPQLMLHKAKLIRNHLIQQRTKSRGLLHCCGADVLDRESVLGTMENFDMRQPVVIVTEGLLLYLNEVEMQVFWSNMCALLNSRPELVWVTDIVTQDCLHESIASDPGVASAVKRVFALTNRSVVQSNPFQNQQCVLDWLDRFQLKALSTIPLTNSLPLLNVKQEELSARCAKLLGNRKIWKISAI